MPSGLPIPDLAERSRVSSYPTNFAQMSAYDLDALATTGEQLTCALLAHYCPALGQ